LCFHFYMSTGVTVLCNKVWIRLCSWITLGANVMPLNNTPPSLRSSILFIWIRQLWKFLGKNDNNATITSGSQILWYNCSSKPFRFFLGRLWEYKTAYRQREFHIYRHICLWRVWKNSFVSVQNWIYRSLNIFWRFRNVAKSHYLLRRVCPSFHPTGWKNMGSLTKDVSP